MRKHVLLLLTLILAACGAPAPAPTPAAVVIPTPEPPLPEPTALAYFDAWMRADYAAMYRLLAPSSQSAINENQLASRYSQANQTATVKFVRASLKSALRDGHRVTVAYHLEWDTELFGALSVDHALILALDPLRNQWGVEWNDGLIWPALDGGNVFSTQYTIPRRANIYDADGKGLAVEGKVVTVGVVPGQIVDQAALIASLSPIVRLSSDAIAGRMTGCSTESARACPSSGEEATSGSMKNSTTPSPAALNTVFASPATIVALISRSSYSSCARFAMSAAALLAALIIACTSASL